MFVIEQPLLAAHAADSEAQVLSQWNVVYDAYNEVARLILGSMNPELHRQFENSPPYDMIRELKSMFEKQAGVIFKTSGTYVLPQDLSVGFILNALTSGFAGFVRNYNMHNMGKTIDEMHALLIEYENLLPKKAETPQVMMIKSGKIQKANKKSLKVKGKCKANGKGNDKQVYIPKPKNPKPSTKKYPTKDDICHHCKKVGYWKRNCPVYLAELLKKKNQVGTGFREARKLKQGALYLYVGNGVRAQLEAIRSYDFVLPNGLVICLDNCHYAPSITRVSKNNVHYFHAIPSNGIYEIDMQDLVLNDNSIYNVSTKRDKHNLDFTFLWHYCIAHISNKRIKRLQQEGILKSTDDESFDQYVSCLSGNMTRKSVPHRPKRATDLLGIIHTNVCGPLRHVSRKGASYFITFMDDYSRTCEARYASQQRSVKCILIRCPKETIDYYFYIPPENKIVIARYAEFFEKNLITQEVSGRVIDLEEIQDEDTSSSEITSEIPMEVEGFEPPQEEVILIRRSERTHQAPNRLCLNVEAKEHIIGDLNEHTSYKAAMLDSESNKWIDAMNAKIQSMIDNMVWVLVDLPPNCKTVGSKWILKKKTDMDGIVHTYKARLVKGYTQLYGVDYEETFSPVADIRAIRILISIAAFYDYEIWQMDVKTAFLNGYLYEYIYMASGSNATFLILYVDDIIIMGNHILSLQSVKDYLGKCFAMKDLGEATFILRIKIYKDRSKRVIGLGQNAYMDKILKRYKMDNSKRGH
nr:hypothetical protein [Tanacetum cinerariifolium]